MTDQLRKDIQKAARAGAASALASIEVKLVYPLTRVKDLFEGDTVHFPNTATPVTVCSIAATKVLVKKVGGVCPMSISTYSDKFEDLHNRVELIESGL